jgi:hypothetical protein
MIGDLPTPLFSSLHKDAERIKLFTGQGFFLAVVLFGSSLSPPSPVCKLESTADGRGRGREKSQIVYDSKEKCLVLHKSLNTLWKEGILGWSS